MTAIEHPVRSMTAHAQAVFVVLATDTAGLRERGVLMRLRGTPVPVWTALAARVAATAVVAVAAVTLLTGVGAGLYGVEMIWRKVPALVLTLALGIGCFSALGLALVALTRTVLIVQTSWASLPTRPASGWPSSPAT